MKDNEEYWKKVRERARKLGSDGCTLVAEWKQDCCYEHDMHCRTKMDIYGNKVERFEADYLFRKCIQDRVSLRFLSPRSWIRWMGVRLGGKFKL